MNKVANIRGPLGLKADKPSRQEIMAGKLHMARVAQLECVICGRWPVEVHHCKSGRFSQRRESDFAVIPLCPECHRTGPNAYHAGQASWEAVNGPDTDYLPVVADMLADELTSPTPRQSMRGHLPPA